MPSVPAGFQIRPGDGASGLAAERRTPVILNRYQEVLDDANPARLGGVRAAVAVPLLHEGRLLGAVAATSDTADDTFTIEDAEALELLGSVTSATLVGLERLEALQGLAEIDALTGLANRYKASELLGRLLRLAARQGRPLSLALLDLDHFKRVNDRYGHPTGDEVLRRIGQLLARSFRGEDVVARWGGEELAIGLYDSDKAATVERVERVLGQLREETFAGPGGATFRVTCSAGVAEYRADGETLQDLYRAADAALYRAKRLGRDRVQPAEAPLLAPPTLRAAG